MRSDSGRATISCPVAKLHVSYRQSVSARASAFRGSNDGPELPARRPRSLPTSVANRCFEGNRTSDPRVAALGAEARPRCGVSPAALTCRAAPLDRLDEFEGATSTASRGSPARRQATRTASCRPGRSVSSSNNQQMRLGLRLSGGLRVAQPVANSIRPMQAGERPMLLMGTIVVLALWLGLRLVCRSG
jgi:hypothetical protein